MIKQAACLIVSFFLLQSQYAGAAPGLRVARSAYEDGLYKIAETQLIQFIKENPGSGILHEAYFLLGECRFNLQDFAGAAGAYSESGKSPMKKEAALYRTASAYYLMGEEDRCRELFRTYLETFPRGKFAGEAAFRLGECMLKDKKFEEAGGMFVRAARLNPEPRLMNPALYSAGIAYLKAENYPEAVSCLIELLEGEPDEETKPGALYWLGHLRLNEGEREEAKTGFARVFENFPDSGFAAAALYRLGAEEMKNENYARAADVLSSLAENYPESPYAAGARLKLGFALESLGERASAARVYGGLADSKACDALRAEALYRKGLSFISEGDAGRGLESLYRLKNLFPGSRESKLGALAECAVLYAAEDYGGVIRIAGETPLSGDFPEIEKAFAFLAAGSHFSLGDYASARGLYEKVLLDGAGGSIAGVSAVYYAKSLHELGLYEKAAVTLNNFTESFAGSPLLREAYFSLAETMFMLGDFLGAAAYYGKASEAPELASPAMFRRGDSLNRAGMLEEAEAAYAKVGGPLQPAAELKIAELRYAAGKFSEAAEAAAKITGSSGREAGHAKILLALCYVHMNELGEAVRELTEFIEQFPGSRHLPAAFFNLGIIHQARESCLEAHSYFEKLERLFPGEPAAAESKYFSGLCLLSAGRPVQAAKKLEEYLKTEGARGEEARLLLGGFYYEQSEYGKALDILAPLKDSKDVELALNAYFQLGLAHEAEKNYPEALEMFRLVLQLGADEAKTHAVMLKKARILSRRQEYAEALEVYRELEKTTPPAEILAEARYYSARMLQSLNRYSEAAAAFREIKPPLAEAMEADISLRIAQCLLETENYEEALLEYLKTAYLYPSHRGPALTALESAAAILLFLERGDEAVKIYEKIIELDPDGIKGEMASQKLREIKP